jgi:hypothetical protein
MKKESKTIQLTFLISILLFSSLSLLISPVKADNTNLALPFQAATYYNGNVGWGWLDGTHPINYNDDPSVEHTSGLPSIKLWSHTDGVDYNYARELDFHPIDVNPGDHIVFSIWIKSTGGSGSYGGRNGMDIIGLVTGYWNGNYESHYISESWLPNDIGFVSWGSDWTQWTMDEYVPYDIYGTHCPWGADYYQDNTYGSLHVSDSSGNFIIHLSATGVYPWLDARQTDNPNYIWFADPIININPSGGSPTPSPTPTSIPSSSPTPTPTPTPTITPTPNPSATSTFPTINPDQNQPLSYNPDQPTPPTYAISADDVGGFTSIIIVGVVVLGLLMLISLVHSPKGRRGRK